MKLKKKNEHQCGGYFDQRQGAVVGSLDGADAERERHCDGGGDDALERPRARLVGEGRLFVRHLIICLRRCGGLVGVMYSDRRSLDAHCPLMQRADRAEPLTAARLTVRARRARLSTVLWFFARENRRRHERASFEAQSGV